MRTFKEISIEYSNMLEGAKLTKQKKWVAQPNNELKKVIKKTCTDSNGNPAKGYKIVHGKKCEKMSPDEIRKKMKTMKKVLKTKKKNKSKIEKKAAIMRKKKMAKGVIMPKDDDV